MCSPLWDLFMTVLPNLRAFSCIFSVTNLYVGLLCFLFASVKPCLSALVFPLVSVPHSSRPVPLAFAGGTSF